MKDDLKTITYMEKAYTYGKMGKHIKELLRIILLMAKEHSLGRMVVNTRVCSKTKRGMALVFISGQTVEFTKENGKLANSMAPARSSVPVAK